MQGIVDWNKIRTQYRLPNERTYLNTSSFGAMSDQTIQVQKDCLDLWQKEGNQLNERANQAANTIREEILGLTYAVAHEVAIIPDVSTAMNHLAELLSENRKIVLLRDDYPATSTPWIVRGFDIDWVERQGLGFELEDIEKAIASGAEVLVLSWVMYNSGTRLDLKAIGELCRQHEVIFIVDATQGLVANPLDLSEVHIDVLLASAFKWMVAGYGIAVSIATKDFVAKHEISVAGQNVIIDGEQGADDIGNYRQGIARFELGHAKIQQVLALENALLELKNIGFKSIQVRTAELMSFLKRSLVNNGIEVLTPEPASNNILMIKGTAERAERLKGAGIDFTYRHGMLRLGVYFYNDEEDVLRLIENLS